MWPLGWPTPGARPTLVSIMVSATSHTFRPSNGVTRGCYARAGQRAVCNKGYRCSVTWLTPQGDPPWVASHAEQNLQSSRQNSRSSKQIARSFLSLESKPFLLTLSRCCCILELTTSEGVENPRGKAICTPSGSLTTRLSEGWRRSHQTISTVCPKQGW
jgi:hypothetical protein